MDGTPSTGDWLALILLVLIVGGWWLGIRLVDGPARGSAKVPHRLYAATAAAALVPALVAFVSSAPVLTFWWWMVWAYPAGSRSASCSRRRGSVPWACGRCGRASTHE